MSDEADNVTHLFDRDRDAPIRSRRNEGEASRRYCAHHRMDLDHEAKRVYCRDCKAEVPSFEALAKLARGWERYLATRQHAEREAKRATEQLADLKRQIRNAKGQLRRATR